MRLGVVSAVLFSDSTSLASAVSVSDAAAGSHARVGGEEDILTKKQKVFLILISLSYIIIIFIVVIISIA